MTWTLDNNLPGTNVCNLTIEDGRIAFHPHPMQSPESLWFRFALQATGTAQCPTVLLWRNVTTCLGAGDPTRLHPVIRRNNGPWERLPSGRRQESPDGRIDGEWELPSADRLEIAFCFPYENTDLTTLLGDCDGALIQSIIGVSENGIPLPRIANGAGLRDDKQPGLFITARQHSGETPGSWVLDGLLRRAVERADEAPLIWAIPFADIDGVQAGAYGKDRHSIDYNRSWGRSPRRHETLCYQADMARWRARCRPLLALDLHAPGAGENTGVYGFQHSEDHTMNEQMAPFINVIRDGIGAWSDPTHFIHEMNYPSRWPLETHPNASRWWASLGLPALTLEIPYQGSADHLFTIADYRAIGARILDACIAYDQLTHHGDQLAQSHGG